MFTTIILVGLAFAAGFFVRRHATPCRTFFDEMPWSKVLMATAPALAVLAVVALIAGQWHPDAAELSMTYQFIGALGGIGVGALAARRATAKPEYVEAEARAGIMDAQADAIRAATDQMEAEKADTPPDPETEGQ